MSGLSWKDGDPPIVGEYLELRGAVGLGRKSAGAVAKALSGSLWCVTAKDGGRLVAHGRVIGDGGLVVSIVDLMVHPDFNLDAIGGEVLDRLLAWCEGNLPRTCKVSLVAQPGHFALYKAAGFEMRTGMRLVLP